MAGWSSIKNESSCCINVDIKVYDECEVRLRSLFDQVLSVSLKKDCSKPLPVVLGDGQSVDLFKLFMVVRERGGLDSVSGDCLWGFVAKQLGFDRKISPSVRLIYSKYLNRLEKLMEENSLGMNCRNGDRHENAGCFGVLLRELGSAFKGLLTDKRNQKGKESDVEFLGCKENGKCVNKSTAENQSNLSTSERRYRENGDVDEKICDDDEKFYDDDEKVCDNDDDVLLVYPSDANKLLSLRKRKRESLSGMLDWVIRVAKCPHDPYIEVIPEQSKWKEHKGDEYWIHAIRAREALVQRRNTRVSIEQSSLLSKQMMHPSMYKDSHESPEKLRCSERLPNASQSRLCPCRNSCSASPSPKRREPNNGFKTSSPLKTKSKAQTPEATSEDKFPVRHVSVGPHFQANVPEWTGLVLDSNSKWLGTCEWPLKNRQDGNLHEEDPIGKGRPDSCNCYLPASVECVRFHTAENRMKLKRELGLVFFRWRFDRMGEEVSLRWTGKEEKAFKDMLTSDSPYFWENACKTFPKKTREDLVSYYFNVLLVKRRRYQNRVTPKEIDSDDDETEFGSIGYSFGHEAVKALGSDILICSQSSRCTDFD